MDGSMPHCDGIVRRNVLFQVGKEPSGTVCRSVSGGEGALSREQER